MEIKGEICFPGDKSISHRALMMAGLTNGESHISNLSTGADVKTTRACLESCGIQIKEYKEQVIVTGGQFSDPDKPLDCENSGTTIRLLLGLLAGQGINATFIGDESLSARPMDRVLDPLIQMGLHAESTNGKLPVTINKSMIKGINFRSPVPSAQIKSAVLLAGLGSTGHTSVTESILSRDHTERMLKSLGAKISANGVSSTISQLKYPLKNFNLRVPGDPSTSAFFAAAASMIPDSVITIDRLLWNPTRTGFYSVLNKMGAGIECLNQWSEAGENIGELKIFYKSLKGICITKKDIPRLIDELPIIAILATQAEGITEITGAEELRVKECDRIYAICSNLKRMGADIKELQDGFIIHGPKQLKGAEIETFHDHRIAMAFKISDLLANGDVVLDDPDCVSVSYPEFYLELERLKQ